MVTMSYWKTIRLTTLRCKNLGAVQNTYIGLWQRAAYAETFSLGASGGDTGKTVPRGLR